MGSSLRESKITYKHLTYLAVAVLFVLCAVMLLAGRYAVPCADDFSYGASAHLAYVETGSVWQAVKAAAATAANMYVGWQGTFSAAFMMAIQPAVFSESLYFLTPIIMLAALLGGTFCLCCVLFKEVFGLKGYIGFLCAACVGIVCTQLVPSPVQGFYWYNGSVYYTFYHGIFLMAIALAIVYVKRGGIGRCVLLCALAVFLGGGNYVTALSCAMLGVGFMALLALLKNKNWKRLIVPTGFMLAAFAVSIVAPGNAVRQASVETSYGPVQAVLLSFKTGAGYSAQWLSLPLLGVLVFLAPAFLKEAGKSDFEFRFPALVSALSFCLVCAMFCPSIYATGSEGDKRLVNIIFYAYVLLWVLNLFYWLGWYAKRKPRKAGDEFRRLTAATLALVVFFGAGLFTGGYTSIMALSLVRSEEAEAYYDCAQRRLAVLKDDNVQDAVLEEYPSRPYLLFFDDITTDPTDWRNQCAAEFYGKNSVVLESK